MSRTINNAALILFFAMSLTFADSTYVSILKQTQASYERQRSNRDSVYNKKVFHYEITPILLALDVFEKNNLPSLANGRIVYFDKYGGIIWTNSVADSLVKTNDSAFIIVKSWMLRDKVDTTFNVLWFKRSSNNSWYRNR
jgi:hypothetical protein